MKQSDIKGRLQLERSLVSVDRLVEPFRPLQTQSQTVVSIRVLGVEADILAENQDRLSQKK